MFGGQEFGAFACYLRLEYVLLNYHVRVCDVCLHFGIVGNYFLPGKYVQLHSMLGYYH